MQENTIDVAKIMREIQASIIPEDTEIINDPEFENLYAMTSDRERLEELICSFQSLKNISSDYLDISMILPTFQRFPAILRAPLSLLARAVRKLTRFFTRGQTVVNQNTDQCLKILLEINELLYSDMQTKIDDLNNRLGKIESKES